MAQVKNSAVRFGFVEPTTPFDSLPLEEREQLFEELWSKGNGFGFMFGGFSDITTNPEANQAACQFIRRKIAQNVKDPEKARKLTPTEWYARRPLCDGGYYEQFNRDNVSIVDLKDTPIKAITSKGILTTDGVVHELDIIIFATGFDAIDGNYNRMRIHGSRETLQEHWKNGPTSYLGISVLNFPNLFIITGPQGPFCNIPPAIETHVDLISELIERAEKHRERYTPVEASAEAETKWLGHCEELVDKTLFKTTESWIFGSNVEGKQYATRFYFGGLADYRGCLKRVREDGYSGFKPLSTELQNRSVL
jgi:cation diffusion facilitator CzcD-associated flavoprotein CzcO